ncbi:hypothetical protein BDV36DRAFT_222247 [Aspergillus pseudocaelatus]|uniref:Uncharacterized protein n=1 Tax=Aspergillus pseudocaelatus TaxID=1825620 RepID=A0ABQ6WZC3_9EURO|nr:hypothetical protein BDV36DRAFT_222247 [Aspergillus pseudocaelatus]
MADELETFAARLASFDLVLHPEKRRTSSAKAVKPIAWPHRRPSPAEVYSFNYLHYLSIGKLTPGYCSWRTQGSTTIPTKQIQITQHAFCVTERSTDGRRKTIQSRNILSMRMIAAGPL